MGGFLSVIIYNYLFKYSIVKIVNYKNIQQISSDDWNNLIVDNDPFISHEFLTALERNNCASSKFGWHPDHITLFDSDNLVAASPLYLKTNSYGELVFDNTWANAYQQTGRQYYPKLVCSVPYTPTTGQRLLASSPEYAHSLINETINKAKLAKFSSVHWLFPNSHDINLLFSSGLSTREDIQFHWHNNDYETFENFLEQLTSKKRKMLRRERRKVFEEGFEFEVIHGSCSNREHWSHFQTFYESTFDNKYGIATLNQAFFEEIADTLGDRVILLFAKKHTKYVAGALFLKSDNRLYGRHWGSLIQSDFLHFETCYYQGIEYCIKNNIDYFEPGAQGEYKLSRGFLPVTTKSAHWIADEDFRDMIDKHTLHEKQEVSRYRDMLMEHSPYRSK